MNSRATGAVLAGVIVLAGLAYAQAPAGQQPGSASASAQRTRGAATADTNIKTARPANRTDAPRPAPENKGGKPPATRGAGYCTVIFDNYTGWFVDTYTDGEFTGTVTPWGDLSTYAIAGGTRLYGRADFEDGQYLYWGPQNVYCGPNGSYTWRLNP